MTPETLPRRGVGINLAIQDAVAAANLLTGLLLAGTLSERDLARVQRRRDLPTRLTQRVQLVMQRRLIPTAGEPQQRGGLPLAVRVLTRVPLLVRLMSRFMALGVRNEHVALRVPAPRAESGAAPAGRAVVR
ncbi:MAG: hypothetical protein M3P93_08485 [Actinomycetota bacterium]|nr:hypothetical protein [Actinomycetota bacterium]